MKTISTRASITTAMALIVLATGCAGSSGGAGDDPLAGTDRSDVVANRPELRLARSANYDYDPPAPGSYRLPVIREAADGRVLGPDGEPAHLRDLMDGRITILSFIYTRCADPRACPLAAGVLYRLHHISQQDPLIARNLRLITMSFDPIHDTPERMADYGRGLRPDDPGAEWLFLTTQNRGDLNPILRAYGQQVARKNDPGDPYGPLYHQLRVYLIDRAGRIRNIYSFGLMDPRMLITDVRTLLLEELSDPT